MSIKILAVETSCDETGVAIIEGNKIPNGFSFTVLSSALHSQAALHSPYGGVYPTLAKREHQLHLPALIQQALTDAGIANPEMLDALAVTSGPGLEPALWTGITAAQELSKKWNIPLYAVNHMEGHLISSLAQDGELRDLQFPVLGLLVSGGHTEFIRMSDWFHYERIGETLDDAVGECFDKVARMLGLPYPGGPEISKLAAEARRDALGHSAITLPRPMIASNNCDVSFSGLKTAALYSLRNIGGAEKLSSDEKKAFAREFEDTVADVFIAKTKRALEISGAATFTLGGGVSANAHLRNSLIQMIQDKFPDVEIRLPELSITGDNAIMIAEAALTHLLAEDWTEPPQEIRANGTFSIEK
jgi:N6-L-threonylcarbamoyladenine synthase